MKLSQCEKILDHMKQFGSINPLEAMQEYGCMRLAARINDLRKDGVLIKDETKAGINRFGEPVHWKQYSLIETTE